MLTLHHHTQLCRSCGVVQFWSHLYRAEPRGTGVELRPVTGTVMPDEPILTVTAPRTETPICIACLPADAARRGSEAAALFEAARRRKRQEALGSTPTAAKQQRVPTLDELV